MSTEISCAEAVDRLFKRVVMVAFLTALISASEAAEYLVSESVVTYLSLGENVLRFLLFALVLLIVINSLPKLLRHKNAAFYDPEGFVTDAFKKSATSSWAVTILFVALSESLVTNYGAGLPAKFFIEVILAVMFGVFSLTFIIVNHSNSDDLDEVDA